MMKDLEYQAYLPQLYWKVLRENPRLFQEYVQAYMEMYYPDLEPVRIRKDQYIICRRKGGHDGRLD